MVICVRLNEEEQRLVGRLARSLRKSRSDVIRAGLEALAERELLFGEKTSASERVEHLLGCVNGSADLSERTGEGFRRLLQRRATKR